MSEILLVNPRRRKRRKSSARRRRRHSTRARRSVRRRRHTARRRNFRVRRVRGFRRNPVSLSVGGILGNLKAGAMGAVGGVANDLVYGYAKGYLPAQLQSGLGRSGAKLLTAALLGWGANKVLKGKGRDLAVGATTVVLHELAKEQLAAMAPNLPLGEYMFDQSNASLLGYNPGEIIEGVTTDELGEYMTVGEMGDYEDGM